MSMNIVMFQATQTLPVRNHACSMRMPDLILFTNERDGAPTALMSSHPGIHKPNRPNIGHKPSLGAWHFVATRMM
jgi:hypothetical protein